MLTNYLVKLFICYWHSEKKLLLREVQININDAALTLIPRVAKKQRHMSQQKSGGGGLLKRKKKDLRVQKQKGGN